MVLVSTLALSAHALITDPTQVFFVVLCIILFAPLLLRRLRIPHVIGLILAGVLVGQYGFNLLERDSSFQLFGQVGIYYIMFLAGLELDMGSVKQYGRKGMRFGLLTFLIPFILGLGSSYHLLHFGLLTSVLLACIYASHTLVSHPIVGRYGMGRHSSVVISVVATAFSIFAALLVLALVVGMMQPDTSWLTWVMFCIKCAAYGIFVLLVYPRLGRWFLRRFDDSVMQYIFILALVFLSASLAKLVGLEGLLGAFLAGLVVNRLIPKTSPLMTRLEFVGNALFIPYFLIGVGMIIDLRIIFADTATLWIVLVMVVTGTLSKLIPAAIMAWTSGESRHGMWVMFGLTNAHAAGALAIVMIGSSPELNLMNDQVLNGTVMLILFSCIISSFATSYGARQLALKDTSLEENRGSYHGKCLITYSQPETVDVMTQLAILIRNPYIPDSLMGLAVAYDGDNNDGVDRHRRGKQLLEQAQGIAAAADVPMATLNRMSTNIAGGILHTMKEYDCGEVIVCLTDRTTGMPKSSLGSIIDSVISGSHREVMAVRSIVPPGTIRRVLIAVPQKAEYEVGFYKWIEHICRVGEQLDCHLEYYAHTDTLPYIRGYMQKKHSQVRCEYKEMNRWTQFLSLQHHTGPNSMLITVTARPGFISYQNSFDSLPLQIHRYFSHTSVMLLYPDQWGDPLESVSVFTPNGTAVTRQNRTLIGWLRQQIFGMPKALLLGLMLLLGNPIQAQSSLHKMSPMLRRLSIQQTAARRIRAEETSNKRVCAMVRVTDADVLREHGCMVLASWGDIHIASIPQHQLRRLANLPEVLRIEAHESGIATNDTSAMITNASLLRDNGIKGTCYTGKGVVVGVMDIGFDLTNPTFRSRDMQDYRIRSFWDMLDTTPSGQLSPVVGREFYDEQSMLAKGCAFDGHIQYHGTHTAGTAAGSGYDSPYVGMAPDADLCLVSNAVSSDMSLIPDSLKDFYSDAVDMLGFKYIFDYADRVGNPCVINFSEGSFEELYGDHELSYEILDSLVRPGRIICASAGNQSVYRTYLHKPVGQAQARSILYTNKEYYYYTLRSSGLTTFALSFFDSKQQLLQQCNVSMQHILECPDSVMVDTLQVGEKRFWLTMASYPSAYDKRDWATELLLQDLTPEVNVTCRVGLTLQDEALDIEAIASGGYFMNLSYYPDWQDSEISHNIHFPGSSPSVICVGSTAYNKGFRNFDDYWVGKSYGTPGMWATYSSVGPSLGRDIKPDVAAPGLNIVSAFNSYYLEENMGDAECNCDVIRYEYNGRQYSWNAQTGTSMSCPIVTGIIAQWMQAYPNLTREECMQAFAASCRQPDPEMDYPNNYYGYGEIDAEAGLRYLDELYTGISAPSHSIADASDGREAVYTLTGMLTTRQPGSKRLLIVGGRVIVDE